MSTPQVKRARGPQRGSRAGDPARRQPREPFLRQAIAIVLVAFAVRLLYIWQIRHAPFFDVLMGDARGYDAWAQQIAGGDWIGHDVFYQAPFYPYFLGALYSVAGRHLAFVRICQAILGSAACVLLALAAWRFCSNRAGLIAGLGLALYAPSIFFDGLLQKSVLDEFFICLALWMLGGLVEHPGRRAGWLRLGLVMGALSLTRENALILIVVMLAWALANPRVPWRSRVISAGVLVFGLSIVLMPVAIRNEIVAGEFALTTAQFGPNFYIGNNAHSDGTSSSLRAGRGSQEYERQDATELAEAASGRQLTPAEVSAYWTGQALAFIRSQPRAWLRLTVRKAGLIWNRTEWLDTESQESYEEWSPMLRGLGWFGHFGVLVPLAMLGAIVTWRERSRMRVLSAMTVAYAASVVMFFISARYRFPMVPFLMLFAAAGIASLPGFVRAQPPARIAATAVAVALVAILTNRPLLSADLMMAITENNLGAALQDARRFDEAAAHYKRAIAIQSDYAPAYNNLGVTLLAQGQPDAAVDAYTRAAALQPGYADPQYNLGNALLQAGRPAKAIDHFARALALDPGSADVQNNLGIALASTERWEEAIAAFEAALRLDPTSAKARENLAGARNNFGIALGSTGKLNEAIAQFEDALKLDPGFADAERNLATARQVRRRSTTASARSRR